MPNSLPEKGQPDRRTFLGTVSSVAMASGLAAGYGSFVVMAGRFLYPAGPSMVGWLVVAPVDEIAVGESLQYHAPSGERVVIARQSDGETEKDFIALSSVCPHLGCRVHWESNNDRFFCPCHNGVFDAAGVATSGPPADAGQSLSRFPLRIRSGVLQIEVVLESFNSPRAAVDTRTKGWA